MSIPRHGERLGFFDGTTTYNSPNNLVGGVAVPTLATSRVVEVGRAADNFSFYIAVTGAPAFTTTWQLQCAHSGGWTAEGVNEDPDTVGFVVVWHDAWYLGTTSNGTSINVTIPSGGGAIMTMVPDFTPGYCRLKRTDANAAVTVAAGWELQGD